MTNEMYVYLIGVAGANRKEKNDMNRPSEREVGLDQC